MAARWVGWTLVIGAAIGGLAFGFIGGMVLGGAVYLALSLTVPSAVRMRGPQA